MRHPKGLLALSALLVALALAVPGADAAPATMVTLGSASTYAVLSGASVGNTVSAPGDPVHDAPGRPRGQRERAADRLPARRRHGRVDVGDAAAAQAHADAVAAYTEVAARTGGAPLAGALAGATITPGLHTHRRRRVEHRNGDPRRRGRPERRLRLPGRRRHGDGRREPRRADQRRPGVPGVLAGQRRRRASARAPTSRERSWRSTRSRWAHGTVVNGRAFALNGALTLDANEFYSAPPVVTIAGGATAITTDTTPTISGTTDVEAPAVVTVTINGQTLTATPSDGAWSVTSAILANGTYPVVASVTDGAGNPGSATQQLTVDTVLPVVTLDGGPSVTTNDPTPTIAGTSDVAPGTVVHVTVGSQTLTALVQTGGTWNITPAALTDGTRTVTVSVTDPAGNPGTDSQTLTVDTTAPAVTITGGANALTNDATPAISGTADVAPGTTVTVTLADETLTGPVLTGGSWSVTAAALSDGPHRVIMGGLRRGRELGQLHPDADRRHGVAGRRDHRRGDRDARAIRDPTITGTSDAAPGTIVTVTIAGQTMTTLLQANGTWNATPTLVGDGTWAVVASATDPAGNVGSAAQTLTTGPDSVGPTGETPSTVTPTTITPTPSTVRLSRP